VKEPGNMKIRTAAVLAAAAALAGGLGLAWADIQGSSHDFSSANWAGGEICKPCHAPHSADSEVGFVPPGSGPMS
jgi:hypothetical protein